MSYGSLTSPKNKQPVGIVRVPQQRMHVAVVTAQDGNKGEVSNVVNIGREGGGVCHVDPAPRDNLQDGWKGWKGGI